MILIGFIVGWAYGMWLAAYYCRKQGESLMETYGNPQGKTAGSDMILKNQAAACFGLHWRIMLWLKPWKLGRPRHD